MTTRQAADLWRSLVGVEVAILLLGSVPPRSLARKIARDETNMSTFECTRKLPQHEYALVLF